MFFSPPPTKSCHHSPICSLREWTSLFYQWQRWVDYRTLRLQLWRPSSPWMEMMYLPDHCHTMTCGHTELGWRKSSTVVSKKVPPYLLVTPPGETCKINENELNKCLILIDDTLWISISYPARNDISDQNPKMSYNIQGKDLSQKKRIKEVYLKEWRVWSVDDNEGCLLYLNGVGGTGKSFLMNLLPAKRSEG